MNCRFVDNCVFIVPKVSSVSVLALLFWFFFFKSITLKILLNCNHIVILQIIDSNHENKQHLTTIIKRRTIANGTIDNHLNINLVKNRNNNNNNKYNNIK